MYHDLKFLFCPKQKNNLSCKKLPSPFTEKKNPIIPKSQSYKVFADLQKKWMWCEIPSRKSHSFPVFVCLGVWVSKYKPFVEGYGYPRISISRTQKANKQSIWSTQIFISGINPYPPSIYGCQTGQNSLVNKYKEFSKAQQTPTWPWKKRFT